MLEFRSRPLAAALLIGLIALIVAPSLTGCGSSPTPRLYILAADATAQAGSTTGHGPTVLVGPIELPAYLDRPQIVTRATANEIRVAEFHRWAEPLKVNLPAVLRDNLAILLDSPSTRALGIMNPGNIDYKVSVTVLRLEADVDGAAVLAAQWQISAADGSPVGPVKRTHLRQEVEALAGMPALVAAENAAVAELSREIADAIIELEEH